MRAEGFLKEWNVRVSVRGMEEVWWGGNGGEGRLTSDCWQKSQARQLPLIHYIAKPIVSVKPTGSRLREGSDREGLREGVLAKLQLSFPD